MRTWTEWETTRRQVAIGGRALDEGGRPVSGAEVALTAQAAEIPPGTRDHKWVGSLAKADGIYYFLDLPAGTYRVRAVDERSGAAGETTASVSWREDGTVRMAVADLKVSKAARGG
ncbi:MAG TPA: carboxypeptidase-like regulatory domain-containing protein [Candidatus Acidoferrum sp.]|nr:carboxypeptidase-like regulatory domain-containing protein [Candidatus Acidoferrum sp.]